jgi:hypothetical protein
MDKICGTCTRWKPPIKYKFSKKGSCPIKEDVYPDDEPKSWCYSKATEEQIKSRVKAGLIEGDAK